MKLTWLPKELAEFEDMDELEDALVDDWDPLEVLDCYNREMQGFLDKLSQVVKEDD